MLDAMNADLAKATAYGKIEQKEVTAWAGLGTPPHMENTKSMT